MTGAAQTDRLVELCADAMARSDASRWQAQARELADDPDLVDAMLERVATTQPAALAFALQGLGLSVRQKTEMFGRWLARHLAHAATDAGRLPCPCLAIASALIASGYKPAATGAWASRPACCQFVGFVQRAGGHAAPLPQCHASLFGRRHGPGEPAARLLRCAHSLARRADGRALAGHAGAGYRASVPAKR